VQSDPVCDATVTLVDSNGGKTVMLNSTNLTFEMNKITFPTENLVSNHSYNVTVEASNIAGLNISHTSVTIIAYEPVVVWPVTLQEPMASEESKSCAGVSECPQLCSLLVNVVYW
jgi:hypothetical protein